MSDDSLCKINLKSGWKQKFFSSDILEKYQDIFPAVHDSDLFQDGWKDGADNLLH